MHYDEQTTRDASGLRESSAAALEQKTTLVDHYRREVREHFIKIGRPELLGRIGEQNIIVFDLLRPNLIPAILNKFLAALAASVNERYHARVDFDLSVTTLAEHLCARPDAILLGARAIRNFVETQIKPALAEHVLGLATGVLQIKVTAEGGLISVSSTAG